MKALLTTAEATPLCGVAEGTLENWRVQGVGPAFIKCGRRVMYDPDDIAAWREENRVRSTSEADCKRVDDKKDGLAPTPASLDWREYSGTMPSEGVTYPQGRERAELIYRVNKALGNTDRDDA